MGYSIIFETKIVKLPDGRLIHFDLSGCNNDDNGRSRYDFSGKIYTEEDFVKYAESLKKNRKPIKEAEHFDLKIGSRYATYYDYGEHLLRMLKRSTTFEELTKKRYFFGTVYEGVDLQEDGMEERFVSAKEWDKICYDFLYGRRKGKPFRRVHTVETLDEVVRALENEAPVSFYIGKKYR